MRKIMAVCALGLLFTGCTNLSIVLDPMIQEVECDYIGYLPSLNFSELENRYIFDLLRKHFGDKGYNLVYVRAEGRSPQFTVSARATISSKPVKIHAGSTAISFSGHYSTSVISESDWPRSYLNVFVLVNKEKHMFWRASCSKKIGDTEAIEKIKWMLGKISPRFPFRNEKKTE